MTRNRILFKLLKVFPEFKTYYMVNRCVYLVQFEGCCSGAREESLSSNRVYGGARRALMPRGEDLSRSISLSTFDVIASSILWSERQTIPKSKKHWKGDWEKSSPKRDEPEIERSIKGDIERNNMGEGTKPNKTRSHNCWLMERN